MGGHLVGIDRFPKVAPLLFLLSLMPRRICQNVAHRSPRSDAAFHVKTLAITTKAIALETPSQRNGNFTFILDTGRVFRVEQLRQLIPGNFSYHVILVAYAPGTQQCRSIDFGQQRSSANGANLSYTRKGGPTPRLTPTCFSAGTKKKE